MFLNADAILFDVFLILLKIFKEYKYILVNAYNFK